MRDIAYRLMRIAAPESDHNTVDVAPLNENKDVLSLLKDNIEELKLMSTDSDIGDIVYVLDGNIQSVLDSVQELCSALVDLVGSEDDDFATISSMLSSVDSIDELHSISTYLNPILRKSEIDDRSSPVEHGLPPHEEGDIDPTGDEVDMPEEEDDEEGN